MRFPISLSNSYITHEKMKAPGNQNLPLFIRFDALSCMSIVNLFLCRWEIGLWWENGVPPFVRGLLVDLHRFWFQVPH